MIRQGWADSSEYHTGCRRFEAAYEHFQGSYQLLLSALRDIGPVRRVKNPLPDPSHRVWARDYKGVAFPIFEDGEEVLVFCVEWYLFSWFLSLSVSA